MLLEIPFFRDRHEFIRESADLSRRVIAKPYRTFEIDPFVGAGRTEVDEELKFGWYARIERRRVIESFDHSGSNVTTHRALPPFTRFDRMYAGAASNAVSAVSNANVLE
ncbi:hypothetical protein BUC_0584 [Burkholderia pseudomallei 576]|nr:hypothetical protein BUC_0584 [Burkholderia pseudomallei 576]